MTDTEAKALARSLMLIATNKALPDHYRDYATGAAHYIEATEARHAAELREQAERFSEALIEEWGEEYCLEHRRFAPFILPKPDPLVEVFDDCFHQNVEEGETWSQAMARKTRAALAARGGRIVWGDDQ